MVFIKSTFYNLKLHNLLFFKTLSQLRDLDIRSCELIVIAVEMDDMTVFDSKWGNTLANVTRAGDLA